MTDNISIPQEFVNTILLILLGLTGIASKLFDKFSPKKEENINNDKLDEISKDIKNIKKDIEQRDLIDAMSDMAEVQNSTIKLLAQIKKEELCKNKENR